MFLMSQEIRNWKVSCKTPVNLDKPDELAETWGNQLRAMMGEVVDETQAEQIDANTLQMEKAARQSNHAMIKCDERALKLITSADYKLFVPDNLACGE